MYASQLTALVMEGQRCPSQTQKAEWAVACWIYKELHRKFQLDPDEAGNFFCDFYPKIRKLILQFENRGYPFEAYLYTTLRWQVLSYKKKLGHERLERQLFTFEPFWEVHQQEPLYSECPPSQVSRELHKTFSTFRKRLIYVALRESEYLDNSLIEALVQYTQIDRRWFLNCVMALRRKVEDRKHRLEKARIYHNTCFYRYYIIQLQIQNCSSPAQTKLYHRELLKVRRRLHRVSLQLQKIHVHPTNKEIAEVLNIPKGSIDSGIYYVLERDSHEQDSAA